MHLSFFSSIYYFKIILMTIFLVNEVCYLEFLNWFGAFVSIYSLNQCILVFFRFKLRGPKHIIFYELPQYAHFYSEMCNMLEDPGRISSSATDTLTCSVLYSKYDAQKLAEVVGTERAKHMLTSDREVHMLVSGER